MKTCYVVGAGDFYGNFAPDESDLVIAADGGLDTLERLGKRYDILLGDMDSVKSNVSDKEKMIFPVKKDETDMFLAFIEGAKRGYSSFRVYGGVGGRIDHTFANLSLLSYAKNKGFEATLIADGYEIFAIKNEKITVSGTFGRTFSIFAYGDTALGVSIRGAKYEADNLTLTPDFPLGVSNSFIDCECEIEVKCGTLLVMIEN